MHGYIRCVQSTSNGFQLMFLDAFGYHSELNIGVEPNIFNWPHQAFRKLPAVGSDILDGRRRILAAFSHCLLRHPLPVHLAFSGLKAFFDQAKSLDKVRLVEQWRRIGGEDLHGWTVEASRI